MRNFLIPVAICTLSAPVFGAEMSVLEKAALNVAQSCLVPQVDQKTYNNLLRSGISKEHAAILSKLDLRLDKKLFDQAIAAGLSQKDALEVASKFSYVDTSNFCAEFRMRVRQQVNSFLKK